MLKAMNSQELDRWFARMLDQKSEEETWYDIAEWFQQETGHLRPSELSSKPAGFHPTKEGDVDCCMDAWLGWSAAKRIAALTGLLEERKLHQKLLAEAAEALNPYLAIIRWRVRPRPSGRGYKACC